MSKTMGRTRRGFFRMEQQKPAAAQPEAKKAAKPSDLFKSCADLYLIGSFPGTYSKAISQAIDWLEFCARVEKAKEENNELTDKEPELAEAPEQTPEEAKVEEQEHVES